MGTTPTEPQVDVVILTWNDGDLLDTAVRSALASRGVDVRVMIVDNGSDLAPELPAPFEDRVALLPNARNRGVAAGRNQGAAVTTAPYVCFLDSDARLLPETLAHLIEPMAADPAVGLTAPVFTGQVPEASAGRAPTLVDKVLRLTNIRSTYRPTHHGAGSAGSWDVDFAIGACQVVRRDVFMAVGGFDEDYFYGPEDVDFCLRVGAAGHRVVQVGAEEAGCHHPPRRRFRGIMTRRGLQHGWAVARHLWRHRHHQVAT